MKNTNILGYVGSGLNFALTAIQTSQPLQVVQLILAILCTIVTISYTIYKWYKNATRDGRITEEEIDEGYQKIKETLKEESEKFKK